MLKFYRFIGRMLSPRAQTWEQVRNAKTMTFVVLFSIVLALLLALAIKLMAGRHV
jgi:hypothetical protein